MCSHICIYIFCLKHYGYIHILCLFPSEYLSPVSDVAKAMETKQDIHQKNMTACLFALGRKKKMNKEKDTQNTVLSTELYLLWYIKANETSFKIRENYLFFAVCKLFFYQLTWCNFAMIQNYFFANRFLLQIPGFEWLHWNNSTPKLRNLCGTWNHERLN